MHPITPTVWRIISVFMILSSLSSTIHALSQPSSLAFGSSSSPGLQQQQQQRAILAPEQSTTVATTSRCRQVMASAFVVASLLAGPAHARQPKNEALCGTGFFENIYQYKCTEIGDIEDEGKAASLSQQEQGATDSLLSKLQLVLEESADSEATTPKKQPEGTK
jgi:hypothetical protein